MTTRFKRNQFAAALLAATIGTAGITPFSVRGDDEFGDNTPYYEDDAWYDISEWFDGNDYNPTDEAIGRWDDERFSFADNLTSNDQDNDWESYGYGDYGYADDNDSDWFYDYYDDGYRNWNNDYYSSYFDTDDDGVYDAYASYTDRDGDGLYDDVNYYAFGTDDQGQKQSRQQAMDQSKQTSGRAMQVNGQIQDIKRTYVRGQSNVIAQVKLSDGQMMTIDLGPEKAQMPTGGDLQIQATGHVVQVGDKKVLIASDATVNGDPLLIDRDGREYQGSIQKTMTTNVRGTKHQLAKLQTASGKTMLVDMGPADNLTTPLQQGDQLTVRGVPVKVADRVVLMARRFTQNGNQMMIDRQPATAN